MYQAIASTASGTFTITVTPDNSCDICMVISEFSGNHATPFDQSNSGTANSQAASSGDVTPTQDNELLVANMSHSGGDRTLTEEGGWTLIQEHEGGTSDVPQSAVYKIQTTATAEDADWTIGTSAVDWGATVSSYKVAAGADASPGVQVDYSKFPKELLARPKYA